MSDKPLLKAAAAAEESRKGLRRVAAILEPLPEQNGYMLALVEVRAREAFAQAVFSVLAEQLERAAASFTPDADIQHRFEQLLEAVNEQLEIASKEPDWQLPAHALNALIAVAVDETVVLSGTGELTALFLHRTEQQRYQVYNLFRGIKTETTQPSWAKAFSVVLDGDLHPGDAFCVTNQDLQAEIPPEELNTILASLPPQGAIEKIRQYYPLDVDLGLLVLRVEAPSARLPLEKPAHDSVEEFEETKERTSRILEDQRPKIRTMLGFFAGIVTSKRRRAFVKKVVVPLIKIVWSAFIVIWHMAFGTIRGVFRFIRGIVSGNPKEKIAAARAKTDSAVHGLLKRFNLLPKTSKYLLFAAIVLLFVFAVSLTFLSQAKSRQAEQETFLSAVKEVERLRDQADGAIIYQDENQARTFMLEAQKKLNALPVDTDEHRSAVDGLRAELNAMADELRHAITIADPPLLGDLTVVGDGQTAYTLAASDAQIYVFGSDKNAYLLDPAAKTLTRAEADPAGAGMAQEATNDNGEIFFVDDRPGLSVFSPSENIFLAGDTAPEQGERWVDVYGYADRAYVLRPGNEDGQIIRFSRVAGGFGSPSSWIRARSTDLSDAISLAVDGTVFVLKQSGSVVRFTSGSEISWSLGAVEPALTSPTDLWTDATSNFIYIIEPSTQRLLVFEKETGNFLVQYRSESFVGLSDFVVDEASKSIYLLAGSKVYRIDATHL